MELHFQLWDEGTERIEVAGLHEFWERRTEACLDGLKFPALHVVDGIGYAALHAMRHLLRGDAKPGHMHEIASFLHRRQDDVAFWRCWERWHDESLRRLETICFRIADAWFDCGLPEAARSGLREETERWLNTHALAPLAGLVTPNKDELWLHLPLLASNADRAAVLRRRLLPMQLPGPAEGVQVPEAQRTKALRRQMRWSQVRRMMSRVWHHARATMPTVTHGVAWWWSGLQIDRAFWRFLAASCLFDLGMFVFILLYNLHLLDLGISVAGLGLVTGAMTAGSLAGILPGGIVVQRLKLQSTLRWVFLGVAGISVVRSIVTNQLLLLGSAFAAGMLLSLWTVCVAPAVTQLTTPRRRDVGFSLFCAAGIGLGIAGGVIGGHLPGWLQRSGLSHPTQAALLVSCALMALSALPLAGLQLLPVKQERRVYARSPFLMRFLAALAVWSLAMGAFNPFFNAFFSRQVGLPVERIGWLFSAAQFTQMVAVLAAPWVYRRFGLVRSIAGMQAATGVALLLLAVAPTPLAAVAYATFMAFQYMSEPGIFTLLMNNVREGERGGASALNMFVTNAGQAVSASIAGLAFARFGYSRPLCVAAGAAVGAAVLFRKLLETTPPRESVRAGGGRVATQVDERTGRKNL